VYERNAEEKIQASLLVGFAVATAFFVEDIAIFLVISQGYSSKDWILQKNQFADAAHFCQEHKLTFS